MDNHFISIILPIYNQADHIEKIIEQYNSVLVKLPAQYEVILVVNGCRDNSLEICNKLSNLYKNIRVIILEKSGWGRAVIAGIKSAKGNLICFTNSARTSEKDLLLFLLYAITNPEVVIKANRKIRDSKMRRIGSLLYNIECRTLFDLSCWDINGTPKVFPRKFDKLMNLTREDNMLDLEFNVKCKEADYPMIEIPTFSPHRHGGRSTTNYGSAVEMYTKAFLMARKKDKK